MVLLDACLRRVSVEACHFVSDFNVLAPENAKQGVHKILKYCVCL